MDRVAVIGLGNISSRHRRNIKLLYPNVKVFGMSASGRLVDEVVDDCDQLVSSIDCLITAGIEMAIVASPAPMHLLHALPLIRAGIPVLVEKPISVTESDASILVEASDFYKTPLAVGYCLRYLASAAKLKDMLSEQLIGQVYNATIEVGQYLPQWRPTKDFRKTVSANTELGGGALLELSHELDFCRWLLGDLKVHLAFLRSSAELDLDVEDLADVVTTTQAGTVVSIHLDFLQHFPYRAGRFIGSKGTLVWDLLSNTIILEDSSGSNLLFSDPCRDKNKMYLDMIRDFENLIRKKPNRCVTGHDALKTISLISEIKSLSKPIGDLK